MIHSIQRFFKEEAGLTSVEYALLLALIVVVAVATWKGLGTNVTGKVNTVSNAIK
jgi:pilus assembly protein Flp/PilA